MLLRMFREGRVQTILRGTRRRNRRAVMMTMMPLFIKGKTERSVDGGFLKSREHANYLVLCDCRSVVWLDTAEATGCRDLIHTKEYRVKSM